MDCSAGETNLLLRSNIGDGFFGSAKANLGHDVVRVGPTERCWPMTASPEGVCLSGRGFRTSATPLKPRRAPLSGGASFQYLNDLVVWVAMLSLRQRLSVWDSPPRAFPKKIHAVALFSFCARPCSGAPLFLTSRRRAPAAWCIG